MRVDAEKDGVARLAADHDDRITPVGRVIRAIRFDDGKWTRLTEGCILRAPVPAAMTPQVGLVTQQYQTTVYDILIYKVSTQRDPLRLRSGPGTDYRILGKYAKETEIIVLDKSNSGWYEVTCPDGKHGYMSAEYLTYVRTDTGSTQSNVGFHNQTIEARQLRDQPFRIYRVVPELDKVTVYARHVFYDLLDNMIKALKPSPDAVGASVVQSLSASCLSAHGFTFYSDLTSSAEDVAWENKNPVEAMLGEGGLVEKYGAELARDWFDVFLVQRVGNDSDVQIRERKNLTGISYDVDETDVVTRIMPTGQDADGNILYLPELYIDSPNIGAYVHLCYVTYVDPDNGLTINVVADITFSQIQTALNAESVWIAGEQLFKYDASSAVIPAQIELTANVANVSMSKWQYKDSSGTWQDYPTTSDNASITSTTLIVKPTHAVFVGDLGQLRRNRHHRS